MGKKNPIDQVEIHVIKMTQNIVKLSDLNGTLSEAHI